jgi:hypothetical protein
VFHDVTVCAAETAFLCYGGADASRCEPDDDGGQDEHRPKVDGALLVARGESTPLFEPIDAAFHHVATFVSRLVEGQRATWSGSASRPLIGTLGNGVGDVALAQEPPTARVAVAFVGDDPIWPGAGPTTPTGAWHPDAVEHRGQLGAVMALSWGDHDRKRSPLAVAREVKLGRQSAAAAPESFIGRVLDPLFTSA